MEEYKGERIPVLIPFLPVIFFFSTIFSYSQETTVTDLQKTTVPDSLETTIPEISRHIQFKKSEALRHRVRIKGSCNGIRSVNVTSDSRYLIITYEGSIPGIRIADLHQLEFLPHAYEGHTDSVRLTSITRDNEAFYTASWDGSSRRYEIATGKCTRVLSGFGRCPSCFVDTHQRYLFTASYDSDNDLEMKNTGRCWDISSGEVIGMYKHANQRITPEAIDIAFDGSKVYTGSDDGYGYRWSIDGETPEIEYFSFKGTVRKIAVSENFFAAACTDSIVRVHNKLTGDYYMYLKHREKDIREVRISKDESRLWTATDNGSLSCYNLVTGDLLYHCQHHSLWIWSMCLMSDDKIVVTGSGDGSVVFLSADTGQVLAQLFNVPGDNDFLIICPPDVAFPTGFFFASDKDFIEVIAGSQKEHAGEILKNNDPRRSSYIEKLNMKNVVITRLKNDGNYNSLATNYLNNKELHRRLRGNQLPLLLKP